MNARGAIHQPGCTLTRLQPRCPLDMRRPKRLIEPGPAPMRKTRIKSKELKVKEQCWHKRQWFVPVEHYDSSTLTLTTRVTKRNTGYGIPITSSSEVFRSSTFTWGPAQYLVKVRVKQRNEKQTQEQHQYPNSSGFAIPVSMSTTSQFIASYFTRSYRPFSIYLFSTDFPHWSQPSCVYYLRNPLATTSKFFIVFRLV